MGWLGTRQFGEVFPDNHRKDWHSPVGRGATCRVTPYHRWQGTGANTGKTINASARTQGAKATGACKGLDQAKIPSAKKAGR
jgi:hypothetical protein